MKKCVLPLAVISLFFLLLFLLYSLNPSVIPGSGAYPEPEQLFVEIISSSGSVRVFVEVADSPQKRTQGLMFREYLEPDHGMLFIFDDEQPKSFWMKNTLIPLDILFIDSNFRIINIEKAVPCTADPCRTYTSLRPAKYVLEVIQGFSEEYRIQAGDKIEFEK